MNENLKDKVFRKVTYPGVVENTYLVSEDGKIYNMLTDRFVSLSNDKDGYFITSLKGKHVKVHRLVAYEFCLENRDLRLVVNHKDGNKQNNHYTNLEWVTQKENTNHAERMGLRNVRGSANGNSKYTEDFIHDICRLFEAGKSNMEVYRLFKTDGLTPGSNENWAFYQLLIRLRHRELWPDVTCQYKYDSDLKSDKLFTPNENSRFNEEEVHQICVLAENGIKAKDIMTELNIDTNDPNYHKRLQGVYEIIRGTNWKYISRNYNLPKINHLRTYDIDNEELYNMMVKGISPKEILKSYGLNTKSDDPGLWRAITRRINNYKKMISIPKNTDVVITKENWEAI